MTLRRQYGDSELVEAAQYAAPGETGCFFPPARYGSGDRLTDAPFTILKTSNIKCVTNSCFLLFTFSWWYK